jgi:mono/diheme cytochrome c family protein
MDDQPKYHEYEPAPLFRNGRVLQAPPAGTIAREDAALIRDARQKPAVSAELLTRGRQQYEVFCTPCHDRVGTGDGIVVQRGFPKPPSLHEDRLRTADDQHLFDVISAGFGTMYAFSDRVAPRDRWAIVAYLRALQFSQHASAADLSPEDRAKLEATK